MKYFLKETEKFSERQKAVLFIRFLEDISEQIEKRNGGFTIGTNQIEDYFIDVCHELNYISPSRRTL